MSHLDDLLAALTGGDESRAEAASSALAQYGEPAISALANLLDDSNVDHRWWAIRTLAEIPGVDANLFLKSLTDHSAEVRQAAALAFAAHPLEDAAPFLIRALSDVDSMVATLASNALIAIGKPAVPGLLAAMETASQAARIHIIHSLAEIRYHRAIPVLMRALDSDSAMLHYWANEGLERLGLNMVYIKPE